MGIAIDVGEAEEEEGCCDGEARVAEAVIWAVEPVGDGVAAEGEANDGQDGIGGAEFKGAPEGEDVLFVQDGPGVVLPGAGGEVD